MVPAGKVADLVERLLLLLSFEIALLDADAITVEFGDACDISPK